MVWVMMIAALTVFFQLDPGDIFAPGINVTEKILFTNLIADDENREIQVVMDGEMRVYPYADEFVKVSGSFVDGDQIVLVAFLSDAAYYAGMAKFTLDPETGEYRYFEPCPGTMMRGTTGDGAYSPFFDDEVVFVVNPESETAHLCWPGTGQLSNALPIGYIGGPGGWTDIVSAPSGEWLLLIAGTSSAGHYAFYGYELASGTVTSLGFIGGQTFSGMFSGWLNDEEFTFTIDFSVDGRSGVYKANITVPDSLERVAYSGKVVEGQVEQLYNTEYCSINLFDLNTLESSLYRFGTHCHSVFRADNGMYLALVREDSALPKLMRLQASAEAETLYEGEIDFLDNMSPDGRYAVLISGDEVIFLDTMTRSVVYTAPYHGRPVGASADRILRPRRGFIFDKSMFWMTNNAALLPLASAGEYEVILFDQNVRTIPVSHVFEAYPGAMRLILQEGNPEDASTYQVFDILSGTIMPLFAEDFPSEQYVVYLFGSDRLLVEIKPAANPDRYAIYEISFD